MAEFSSNASAAGLGYLYQVRYALYLLLERAKSDERSGVSVERLDDVAFEKDGSPEELLQLKHTVYPARADLSDASERLWKTLRIWSLKLKANEDEVSRIVLSLVSTGRASNTSAAGQLRPAPDPNRNVIAALKQLRETAQTSTNKDNQPAYKAFLSLSAQQQERLVQQIQVLDEHPNIQGIQDLLLREFRVYTPKYESLYTRLEGWWFGQVVNHLLAPDQVHVLRGRELSDQIQSLIDQLRSDSLPNDFPDVLELDESNLSARERIFVEQLKLILISDTRIRLAIGHYHRAFRQRHRWLDEGLIFPQELEAYEKELIAEWRTQFLIMKEDLIDPPDEADMQRLGRQLFNQFVETRTHRPVRERYRDTGFSKGVLHMLSNDLHVGWHGEFEARLTDLMLTGARMAQ